MIVFKTNYGDIHIELDFEKAPLSAANFLAYAKGGYYDGTIFHRVLITLWSRVVVSSQACSRKQLANPSRMKLITACRTQLARLPWHALLTHIQPVRSFLSTLPTTPSLTTKVKQVRAGATLYLANSLKAWTLLIESSSVKPDMSLVTRMYRLMKFSSIQQL